jgi:hypothetical protein
MGKAPSGELRGPTAAVSRGAGKMPAMKANAPRGRVTNPESPSLRTEASTLPQGDGRRQVWSAQKARTPFPIGRT